MIFISDNNISLNLDHSQKHVNDRRKEEKISLIVEGVKSNMIMIKKLLNA